MDYKNKYLKYRNKYILLKNQIGGNPLNRFGKEIDKEDFKSKYEILDSYKLTFIIRRKIDGLIFKVNLPENYPHNSPIVCYIDNKVQLGVWGPTLTVYQLLDKITNPPTLVPHQANNSEKCGIKIPVADIIQYIPGYSYPLTPHEYLEYLKRHQHVGNISKLKLASTFNTGYELDMLLSNWMYFEIADKRDILGKMSIFLTTKNGYTTNLNVAEVPKIEGNYSGLLFFSEPHLTELSKLFNFSRGLEILTQWQRKMTLEMDFVYIAFGDLDRKEDDTEKEWGIIDLSKLTEMGRECYKEWKK